MFSSLNETEIQENIPAMLVTLRGMAGYKNNQNALTLSVNKIRTHSADLYLISFALVFRQQCQRLRLGDLRASSACLVFGWEHTAGVMQCTELKLYFNLSYL